MPRMYAVYVRRVCTPDRIEGLACMHPDFEHTPPLACFLILNTPHPWAWVPAFPEPTLRGFRHPLNPRAWVPAFPEPRLRGFRHSRNPRPPQSVGSEQSILRTHAFLEFHFRGLDVLPGAGRQSEVVSVLQSEVVSVLGVSQPPTADPKTPHA